MAQGIGVELEELGVVALIGSLVVPGMAWISKGKTNAAMVRRTALLAAFVAAALVIETTMDRSANAVADSLD